MKGMLISAGVAALLLCGGCAHQEGALDSARTDLKNQDDVIRDLRGKNEALMQENILLRSRAEACEAETQRLKDEIAALRRANSSISDLERKLKEYDLRHGAIGDVEVLSDPLGVKFRINEALLFEPGKFQLKESGKSSLREVAARLNEGPEMVVVEGHTDNQPVKHSAKENPLGNLELSGKRALYVAHFLTSECAVAPTRISFQGYGEYKPTVANDTRENMAKNRRVDILVLKGTADK